MNRLFDDQQQPRERLEAEAKLIIQANILEGRFELAWSYIVDYENSANPFPERRRAISAWKEYAKIDVSKINTILENASVLVKFGLNAKDALHISCAIAAECDYFLTTDDKMLKHREAVKGVILIDPLSFLREIDL